MAEDTLQLDERTETALLALLEGIEKEDEVLRLQQMREFKKNNLFWHGFQYLFWSDVDSDWRIPTHADLSEISTREETRWVFNHVLNHFKAHGESIIAALSADIPDVRFGPRNAEDPNDRRAVEAASNCAELIEKWNRAKLLIITALFHLCTEGFVASYTYNKKDPQFGTAQIPEYDVRTEKTVPDMGLCPSCGYSEEQAEPVDSPVEEQGESVQQVNKPCPQCGAPMDTLPGLEEEVPFMSGTKPVPKGREVIEIYGPLNVRVPSYVTKQADAGYLIHYVDGDPALFKSVFPSLVDKIESDSSQSYERLMRQTSLSMEGYQLNVKLTTQKKVWLRPWTLYRLSADLEDLRPQLLKKFPNGIYFSVIGRTICELRDESMDNHWSLTKAGPSKGVHADPVLKSLISPQEIKNNLTNMFVMQVEYGIPATYADTEVFDFEGQSKQEVSPGYIYPVTPRPGQSIGDAFYSEKTAILSKEATELLNTLNQDEQFLVGSFPSIYGGPSVSGSKTLGEYDKSRSFALQRLSLVWYFINVWWGETIHKAVLSFVDHQIEDEPLTTRVDSSRFQTKWIKKADLSGSFDRLEPEASSDFPTSFSQKRSTLMQILQLNLPEINSVLFTPENAEIVKSYVGLPEVRIPMEIQRRKQIREILQLIGMTPDEGAMPMSMASPMMSPVPVEPDIDDHAVHIEVLIDFLVGDTGQDLKENNPQGYASCLAHLMEHKQLLQAQMPAPMPSAAPAPGAKQNTQQPTNGGRSNV